jgi:hypothetical protein
VNGLPDHAAAVAARHHGRGEVDPHRVAVDRDRDVDEVVDALVEAALPRYW